MIRIAQLNKAFDGKNVISDLNIIFPDIGTVAICGPSGCGKSTLLSIVSGLTAPDSGKIFFSDNSRISVSFQESRLLAERTAEQNVNVVLGDKKATISRARCLLSELGIDAPSAFPDELSGGMKARVSIARALALNADIYLFDEPFAALDAETARLVANVIKKKTENKLCIAVIHDTVLAEEFADTVIRFGAPPLTSYEVSGKPLPLT